MPLTTCNWRDSVAMVSDNPSEHIVNSMHRFILRALLFSALSCATGAYSAAVLGQGTWETTLVARDIDGDTSVDAYYDKTLDITWLANWNAVGYMDWNAAGTWASELTVHGVSGWRLPSTSDIGAPGCDWSWGGTDCGYNSDPNSSELAHMYFVTLGNKSQVDTIGDPQPGGGLTNTANFSNMQSSAYWSGTAYALTSYGAWHFSTASGYQTHIDKSLPLYVVAVHDGDIAPIPEPRTFALMLFGLWAVCVVRRKVQSSRRTI